MTSNELVFMVSKHLETSQTIPRLVLQVCSLFKLYVGWSRWIANLDQNAFLCINSCTCVHLNKKIHISLNILGNIFQKHSMLRISIFSFLVIIDFGRGIFFDKLLFGILLFLLWSIFFVTILVVISWVLPFLLIALHFVLISLIFFFFLRDWLFLLCFYCFIVFFFFYWLFFISFGNIFILLTLFFLRIAILMGWRLNTADAFNLRLLSLGHIEFLTKVIEKIPKGHVVLDSGQLRLLSRW